VRHRHQVREVSERYCPYADDLVVLVIDSGLVPAPVRDEAPAPEAQEYPHIYGPLSAAVTQVIPVDRDEADRFILPGVPGGD
jgi:uncharacterized protein (DUF952 family)